MRSRVSGATSVRPLSTFDTVDSDTPASAAMLVSVLTLGAADLGTVFLGTGANASWSGAISGRASFERYQRIFR